MGLNGDTKGTLKKLIPSFVCGSILLISIVISSMINNGRSHDLSKLEAKKVELQNKIDRLSVQNNTKVTKVKSQVSGARDDKVGLDDETINNLMKYIFTWKSYDEYSAIRKDLIEKYYLKTDSSFLNVFMPDIYNEEINGKKYNRIDVNGYNITYNGIKTYVTNVDKATEKYTYFAIVSVTTKSANEGEQTFDLALEYGMTKDSKVVDLVGYTLN
jgi:hypothetical protein